MNRRIPPDELPWFKRPEDREGFSGQLHYAAPIGVADVGRSYCPIAVVFPYMLRTWSVYRPKVLVVSSYPRSIIMCPPDDTTTIDMFSTFGCGFSDAVLRDVAPHYDLILAEYCVMGHTEWWAAEILARARCMLMQWMPDNGADIGLEVTTITPLLAAMSYRGFCRRGQFHGAPRACLEQMLAADLKMFHQY